MSARWSAAEDARLLALVSVHAADDVAAYVESLRRHLPELVAEWEADDARPVELTHHVESADLGYWPAWSAIAARLGRPRRGVVARFRKLAMANDAWHYTCSDTGTLFLRKTGLAEHGGAS